MLTMEEVGDGLLENPQSYSNRSRDTSDWAARIENGIGGW